MNVKHKEIFSGAYIFPQLRVKIWYRNIGNSRVPIIFLQLEWKFALGNIWNSSGIPLFVKSVTTLQDRNFASFWARDSSKKAFCSSWLALSNGMKSEGSAGRAVHVQGDWKLCTCTARQKKIFKPGSRWIRVLRQKLYSGAKNLGNRRNFCKHLGSALSDSTIMSKAQK